MTPAWRRSCPSRFARAQTEFVSNTKNGRANGVCVKYGNRTRGPLCLSKRDREGGDPGASPRRAPTAAQPLTGYATHGGWEGVGLPALQWTGDSEDSPSVLHMGWGRIRLDRARLGLREATSFVVTQCVNE